jgi:hypothetical protein
MQPASLLKTTGAFFCCHCINSCSSAPLPQIFGNHAHISTYHDTNSALHSSPKIFTMPWLSRQSSAEHSVSHPKSKSTPTTPPQDQDRNQKNMENPGAQNMPTVTFIPALIDGLCGTNPPHTQSSPLALLWSSLVVLLRTMAEFPSMLWHALTLKTMRAYASSPTDLRDLAIMCMLGCMQMMLFVGIIPMMLCLPGLMAVPILALMLVANEAGCWVVNGGQRGMTWVRGVAGTKDGCGEEFEDEAWIFVPGPGTR